MLLPNGVRVVLEVDGRQHYAGADSKADPDKYAAMVAADRDLRVSGYDVYRFGAAELMAPPGRLRLANSSYGCSAPTD
jgi:very-short-patch-repair endonuclease